MREGEIRIADYEGQVLGFCLADDLGGCGALFHLVQELCAVSCTSVENPLAWTVCASTDRHAEVPSFCSVGSCARCLGFSFTFRFIVLSAP
jgi:hypothetical protein